MKTDRQQRGSSKVNGGQTMVQTDRLEMAWDIGGQRETDSLGMMEDRGTAGGRVETFTWESVPFVFSNLMNK